MNEPTIADLVEALKDERPPVGDGETCVFLLPDHSELVVKHWPSASLEPHQRWEASIKTSGRYDPPLAVVRVEEGT